jgi:hypothetical protein
MAKNTESYEVLVEELTVLKTVSSLPQGDGSVKHQNGMGRIYFEGEKVPAEEVAEDWKEALDSKEGALYESLSKKLKPSSDDAEEDLAYRLGLPFEGYDDMETDEILAAIRVLPSATVQRIKEYESNRDDPRTEIVDFSIGFGEHPDQRQLTDLGEVMEDVEMATDKAAGRIKTRSVPASGPVEHGEGITGTGEPDKAYGQEADAEDDKKAGKKPNIKGAARKASQRRGRRDRQPQPTRGTPKDQGGSSLGKTNED